MPMLKPDINGKPKNAYQEQHELYVYVPAASGVCGLLICS